MSASLDHMGAFAEQLRREVYPLRDLHPALADDVHRLFIAIEDPILVVRIRRRFRNVVARELRYMAQNYETMPGRKQSDHLRQAWHYRQQARRLEARP
jgi:hypothetical protein